MPVRITIELRPYEAPFIESDRILEAITAAKSKGASTRELMKLFPNTSITAISKAAWQLCLAKKVRSAWTHVARGTPWAPPVEARYWLIDEPTTEESHA